jgi:hypothetical protein
VGIGVPCVDAHEDLAEHTPVRVVEAHLPGLGEDRGALWLGRVGIGEVVQPSGVDRLGGRLRSEHHHVVVVAQEGSGEGDERTEMPGAPPSADHDSHGGDDALPRRRIPRAGRS